MSDTWPQSVWYQLVDQTYPHTIDPALNRNIDKFKLPPHMWQGLVKHPSKKQQTAGITYR